MAIQVDDNLAKTINTNTISERIESFIWISLAQKYKHITNIQPITNDFRDHLADCLNKDAEIKRETQFNLQNNIIPEHNLNWITNSHRQATWIEQYITTRIPFNWFAPFGNPLPPSHSPIAVAFRAKIPPHLLKKNRSVAIFDYCAANSFSSMIERINQCEYMKNAWKNHEKQDKHFSWLNDGAAEEKREFFCNWLISKQHNIFIGNTLQSHEELLTRFDHSPLTENEKITINQTAKRRWDQQQRRSKSNGKRQCNLEISESAITTLAKLAQKHGLSRAEIIELLIESESKHEHYISERLMRKNLLTKPLE